MRFLSGRKAQSNFDVLKMGLVVSIMCLFGLFSALGALPPGITKNIAPSVFAAGGGPITRTASAQVTTFDFSTGFGSLVNCCEFPTLGMTITKESNGVNWVNATSFGSGAAFHGPGKNQTLGSSLTGDFTVQAIFNVTDTASSLGRVGVFLYNSSGFTYFFGWVQYTTTGGVPQYSYFYGENGGSTDYAGDPGSNATWNTPYAQRGQLTSGSTTRTFGDYENIAIQRHGTTLEWRVNGTEIASHSTTASTQTGVSFVIQQFSSSTANRMQIAYLGVSSSTQNVTVAGVSKAIGVTQQNSAPFGQTDLLPSMVSSSPGLNPIGTAVVETSSASVAGNMYAVGGFTGGLSTNPSNKFQQYTPNNNTWTTRANYPQTFWGMACADPGTTLATPLYCFAGTDGTTGPPHSNNKYNFLTNAWSAISTSYPASTNLTGFFGMDIAADTDNGAIYLGSCAGSGANTNACSSGIGGQAVWLVYTPGNNSFRKLANIPTGTNYGTGPSGVGDGTAFYKSNNVFIVGGVNITNHVLNNQVYEYNIPTDSWTKVCLLCFTTIYPFAGATNGFIGANMNTGNVSSSLYGLVGGEDNVGTNVYATLAFYDPVAQTVTKDFNVSAVPCAIEAFEVYTNSDEFYSSCSGTSGTQSNTATTSTYKVHMNFATLWVPWYSEIGLVNWTTRSNGISQGVNNFNFIMPGDLFTYSTPGITQPAICTMSKPGPQTTLALSGTSSPIPSSLLCDGNPHNITVQGSPGATLVQEVDNGSGTSSGARLVSVAITGVQAGDTLVVGGVAVTGGSQMVIFGNNGISCKVIQQNQITTLEVVMSSCVASAGGSYIMTAQTGNINVNIIAIYVYEFQGSGLTFQFSNGANTQQGIPGTTTPHTNTVLFSGPSYLIGFLTVNFASSTSTVSAGGNFTLGNCYRGLFNIIFACAENLPGALGSTTFPFTLSVAAQWTDEGLVVTGPPNTLIATVPAAGGSTRNVFAGDGTSLTFNICAATLSSCPTISMTAYFQLLKSLTYSVTFGTPITGTFPTATYTNAGASGTIIPLTLGGGNAWMDNDTTIIPLNPWFSNLLSFTPTPTSVLVTNVSDPNFAYAAPGGGPGGNTSGGAGGTPVCGGSTNTTFLFGNGCIFPGIFWTFANVVTPGGTYVLGVIFPVSIAVFLKSRDLLLTFSIAMIVSGGIQFATTVVPLYASVIIVFIGAGTLTGTFIKLVKKENVG